MKHINVCLKVKQVETVNKIYAWIAPYAFKNVFFVRFLQSLQISPNQIEQT